MGSHRPRRHKDDNLGCVLGIIGLALVIAILVYAYLTGVWQ